MRTNSAGCLTGLVASFSRIFLIFAWFARPLAFDRVFSGSWLLPCLGIMILPFTTLMYVILVTNGVGTGSLSGLDWLWMALAVLIDLASIGAAGAANRNQIPQGYPGAMPPQPPMSTPPAAPKP